MRKLIYGIVSAIVIAAAFALFGSSPKTDIAVIVPLQHAAMDAIVEGLKQEFKDVSIHVYNAQGDSLLQSAIFQQLQVANPKVILPIGTATAEMALKRLPNINMVHLAAKYSEKDRVLGQKVCGVLDEIPVEKGLQTAILLIPELKKVTLIHSATEKTFPEAAAFEAEAARLGIQVQRLMIQSQNELYTMAQQLDQDTQLLAVLKDHMVVAGISTLIEQAKQRGIPLMAADEGSVQEGATFAVGVTEASIGTTGAHLVKMVLDGQSAGELPILSVEEISLFYQQSKSKQFDFKGAASTMGFTLKGVK